MQVRRGPRASLRSEPGAQQQMQQAAIGAVRGASITAPSRSELNARLLGRIPPAARFVMIGEASHGTREFYEQRAELTQLLISERGFTAVLVESDWPDAFRANRYVLGVDGPLGRPDSTANEALGDYKRFPRWVLRNTSVAPFIEWMRQHNADVIRAAGGDVQSVSGRLCRFLGLDVYSLHSSAEAIIAYLRQVDPAAAEQVAARYECFNRYGGDAQSYGMATALLHKASCEAAVKKAMEQVFSAAEARRCELDGHGRQEEALMLEANAMAVAGAEAYYRNMFTRDEVTWNLRDSHFLEVVKLVERHLARLAQQQGEAGRPDSQPKMVLWAHNSHLGDARATDASWVRQQLNIGQLMREKYGSEVASIGCHSLAALLPAVAPLFRGFVSAADDWGKPVQHKAVRPSLPGCYEHLLHSAGVAPGVFGLDLREPELQDKLHGPLLERAIGVIYRPRSEMQSHYFDAHLPQQFDFVVHHDTTSAVVPLEPGDYWAPQDIQETKGDMPELWPAGE